MTAYESVSPLCYSSVRHDLVGSGHCEIPRAEGRAGGSKNMGGLTEMSAGLPRMVLCTSGSCSGADRGDTPAVPEVSQGLETTFSSTELVWTDLCTNTPCLPHSQLKGTLIGT